MKRAGKARSALPALFFLIHCKKNYLEVTGMELADIRNELERTAKVLADFRGSL